MLAVRIGQLTAGDFHPIRFTALSAVPQQLGEADLPRSVKYHKHRGWEAVARCVFFAAIAMLGVAWVAVKTGHPNKIRSARTWISLN